jgi:carbon monoxide dehydrogenase subunit G
MKFEHSVVIGAPKDEVKRFLDDVPAAASCLPGVEDVREVEAGLYEGRIRVRIGPLGLNISGRGRVEQNEGSDKWKIEAEGRDGRAGAGVKASLDGNLKEIEAARTEVSFIADVQFSGRLAELGQPLIRRKASSIVEEFAENLRRAVER